MKHFPIQPRLKSKKEELAEIFKQLADRSSAHADRAFEMIDRLMKNVIENPGEERFRRIKLVSTLFG